MRKPSRIGIAVAVPVLATTVVAAAASSASAASHVRHLGTRPSWATASRDVGRANGSDRVDLRVWLQFRDAAQVRALAAAVTDPKSPQYRHYLTPAQFTARYAPTASQANAVAAWLRSAGLRVTAVPATHRYVGASGSVTQVQQAFGVGLNNYAVGSHTWRAPGDDPSVPSSLAPTVLGITGLDTGDHANHPATHYPAPPAGFRNDTPLSAYYGEKLASDLPPYNGATLPYAVQGYTPPDYRSAYGVTASGLSGAGTTIGIVDAYASGTMVSDANTYAGNHDAGTTTLVAGTNYLETIAPSFTLQGPCDASGWEGEESLDVEAAHGMAPGADIHYYGAANCNDPALIDALQAAVNDHVNVVSNSWDGYESQATPDIISAYDSVFEQGTVQGTAFLFSSGDDGDELSATGTKQVDFPTSDPLVVSVGGTSVGIKGGAFVGQDGWGTHKSVLSSGAWGAPAFLYGSGGGCSGVFSEPSWQSGTNADACGGKRGVPDVSMDGDPTTGMLIGETQTFPKHHVVYGEYRIGGTSLSSPLLAGVVALADQTATSNITGAATFYGVSTGITDVLPHGSPGTLPDAGNVRNDYVNSVDSSNGVVTSVRTFGEDSSLTVTGGWDPVTGLGTVNGRIFKALGR